MSASCFFLLSPHRLRVIKAALSFTNQQLPFGFRRLRAVNADGLADADKSIQHSSASSGSVSASVYRAGADFCRSRIRFRPNMALHH